MPVEVRDIDRLATAFRLETLRYVDFRNPSVRRPAATVDPAVAAPAARPGAMGSAGTIDRRERLDGPDVESGGGTQDHAVANGVAASASLPWPMTPWQAPPGGPILPMPPGFAPFGAASPPTRLAFGLGPPAAVGDPVPASAAPWPGAGEVAFPLIAAVLGQPGQPGPPPPSPLAMPPPPDASPPSGQQEFPLIAAVFARGDRS